MYLFPIKSSYYKLMKFPYKLVKKLIEKLIVAHGYKDCCQAVVHMSSLWALLLGSKVVRHCLVGFYVATPTKSMSQMAAKTLESQRPAASVSMKKSKKIRVSIDRQYTKLNRILVSAQLPCLPSCNYGNGSVSWMINVSYTVRAIIITR